jgi:hypothetical protein
MEQSWVNIFIDLRNKHTNLLNLNEMLDFILSISYSIIHSHTQCLNSELCYLNYIKQL